MSNKKLGNNKGVTLVEMLIALVVLLIVFMGLLQATLLTMQTNVKNSLRDDAVRVLSDRLAVLRGVPYSNSSVLPDNSPNFVLDTAVHANPGCGNIVDGDYIHDNPYDVPISVRNTTVHFYVTKVVCDIDSTHKVISLKATWSWQSENYQHTLAATRVQS